VIRTLSGFLGLPSDWDFLPWPHAPYDGAADEALIGYSMGGRLALEQANRFPKVIIISAGINAPDEERLQRDAAWSARFESEDWSSLMRAWNAQPVFGGHVVERHESDYDRVELARMLREHSPAVLAPPRLEEISSRVLWVAGELDSRYVDIARVAVSRLQRGELWICPNAGHRVPWEQPDALVARLRTFLEMQ
jgi:2-succinyl-6-hydroxy-2,4-cyclohexadiene-1-carboxylate synthase